MITLTKEGKKEALNAYADLFAMIESGEWDYSPERLAREYAAYRAVTIVEAHPIAAFALSIPFFGLPLFKYFLCRNLRHPQLRLYELHFLLFKLGRLGNGENGRESGN